MADNLHNFIHLNSELIDEIRKDINYINTVDNDYCALYNIQKLEKEISAYINKNCIMHDPNWNFYIYNIFEKRPTKVYHETNYQHIITSIERNLCSIICYDTDFDKINWTKIEKKDSDNLKAIKLFFKINQAN
jgi:hypothetical protein